MSLIASALLLVAAQAAPNAQADAAPAPPGDLLFGFYRLKSFHDRGEDLHCGGPDKQAADAEFDAIRKRLIDQYGKKPFSPPRAPPWAAPGDCRIVVQVYRTNLAHYRRLFATALSTVTPAARGQE
jgi:hypothetical protein